jgi:glutamine amidotransferase
VKDIALIDYGAGNLASVRKGFSAVGAYLFSPSRPADLAHAKAIVVPGVGHFQATRALTESWTTSIRAAVPDVPGLALLEGRCTRLPEGQKVPHVGWNALTVTRQSRLLSGVESGTQVYFAHAFAAPVSADCVAVTTHGRDFAAVVERDAVFGVQFHPEKSSAAGLRLLENFVELVGTASVASR